VTITIVRPPAAKVELLSWTSDPASTITKVARTFKNELSSIEPGKDLIIDTLEQLQRTELQGPLEMVSFVWLITDVTRAFTHQLVRYRIGTSFIQESLRFSEKTDAKVLATTSDEVYANAAIAAVTAYQDLLAAGVPAEDARGILPTNILTSIFFSCSLRTLINIWSQRMCLQAQHGEWEAVLSQMKRALNLLDSMLAVLLRLPCLVDGICRFNSVWDRPCAIRLEEIGYGSR